MLTASTSSLPTFEVSPTKKCPTALSPFQVGVQIAVQPTSWWFPLQLKNLCKSKKMLHLPPNRSFKHKKCLKSPLESTLGVSVCTLETFTPKNSPAKPSNPNQSQASSKPATVRGPPADWRQDSSLSSDGNLPILLLEVPPGKSREGFSGEDLLKGICKGVVRKYNPIGNVSRYRLYPWASIVCHFIYSWCFCIPFEQQICAKQSENHFPQIPNILVQKSQSSKLPSTCWEYMNNKEHFKAF